MSSFGGCCVLSHGLGKVKNQYYSWLSGKLRSLQRSIRSREQHHKESYRGVTNPLLLGLVPSITEEPLY